MEKNQNLLEEDSDISRKLHIEIFRKEVMIVVLEKHEIETQIISFQNDFWHFRAIKIPMHDRNLPF